LFIRVFIKIIILLTVQLFIQSCNIKRKCGNSKVFSK